MSRPDDLSGGYVPSDLAVTGKTIVNKAYLDLPFSSLAIGTKYNFQFSYVDLDNNQSDFSPVFEVTTSNISAIQKPRFTSDDLTYTTNTLLVSWNGKDYLNQDYDKRFARIDIYAKGGSFGSTYKVVGQFLKAGTQTITSLAGQYWVKLQAVSVNGLVSDFSAEQTIITESPIVVDTDPPPNPSGVTVSTGVDPKDQTGFSAYATFSWTHHPNAATNGTRGYRIRWTYDTTNPIYEYGFVDYPNNSYTATGLIPNVEYSYQVASVDQFNNTQSYYTGGTFTASDPTNPDGWARLKSYLSIGGATGDLFKFGTGIPSSINTSLTTTPSLTSGNYNGIILNKTGNNNNYWLTTGQFRVGGNTQFMYWDGTNLSITGDLGVGGGATIAGNLFMKTSGASIYSGSLTAGALAVGTAGYILNNDGLLVQNNETGTNRKYVRIDPATGTLFANNAQITGNVVITGGSTKTAIDDAASAASAASTAAANASAAAASKNRTFTQSSAPTNPISGYSLVTGDIWFDDDDGYRQYRWNGSSWVDIRDTGISAAQAAALNSLQKGGNAIINPSTNQITTIDITGIKIASGGVNLNGAGTATTSSAGTLVLNSQGITAKNANDVTTFFIDATSGNAEFLGTIKSGSTITGATVQTTADSSYGSIRMVSPGGTLEVLNQFGSVSGQLYAYNSGNELILRHGSTRTFDNNLLGYPTSSAMLSLNPYTITLQFTGSTGAGSTGLDISSNGDNYFTGTVQSDSSGGANSVGNTLRYFRNTIINNTTPSGSGFSIGDIWIQY